jgi:hypothetical protein
MSTGGTIFDVRLWGTTRLQSGVAQTSLATFQHETRNQLAWQLGGEVRVLSSEEHESNRYGAGPL